MEVSQNNLVLIVDDNPHNIQVLAALVAECGYNSGIAMDAKEAYHFLENKLPALILLDIMMPEIDGYEACRHIKSNPKHKDIPIIFLTAKNEKEDIVKGFEAGGVDYVTKPFNSLELKMRITTHINLKNSYDLLAIANRKLAIQAEEMAEINATKDKLFSIIAHDLRSPFQAIFSFTEILQMNFRTYESELIEELLEHISSASKNTYELLETLLDWAKSQTKRANVKLKELPISEIIDIVLNTIQLNALNKKITLNYFSSNDLSVLADEDMFKTILRNLISNSIKFTNLGGEINIYVKENDDVAEISVEDNGVGMSDEIRDKLFLSKVNSSTKGTNDEKGTGLGLVICKEFVEKLNGKIWVESQINKGTTIRFTLPLAKN